MDMWQEHPTFKHAKEASKVLRVVNDSAERGTALASCNHIQFSITNNKEEKQYLQYLNEVIESHQKYQTSGVATDRAAGAAKVAQDPWVLLAHE